MMRLPETYRRALGDLGFVAAYLLLDWASEIEDTLSLGITPWSPSTGLALAWLVMRGVNRTVPLYVASVLSGLFVYELPGPFALTAAAAAIITLGYAAAAALLVRSLHFDRRLESLRDLLVLLGCAATTAAVVGVVYVAMFLAAGKIAYGDFQVAVLRSWVGDMIGITVVTPALLRAQRWREWGMEQWQGRLLPETLLEAMAIIAVLWIIFGLPSTDEYKFFYLLFVPVVTLAVRQGADGACLANLIAQVGMIALVRTHGFGSNAVTDFQLVLLALTVTSLLTGIVVSERQRAERMTREYERRLRERQEELERVSRLSTVGEMSSTLAHELNQPMTAGRAYIRAAQRLLAGERGESGEGEAGDGEARRSRAAEAIGHAVSQIDLAANIVRSLRELVRGRLFAPQPVDIADVVDQSLALVASQARLAGIEIRLKRRPAVLPVVAERIRVQQVLLNLIRNAIDAVSGQPLERRRIDIDVQPAEGGRMVQVAVRDHGPGVSTDIAPRLFTAFTTSKAEGLGLGLSISRGIVQAHGGRLWLESSGADGTCFCFTLPTQNATVAS